MVHYILFRSTVHSTGIREKIEIQIDQCGEDSAMGGFAEHMGIRTIIQPWTCLPMEMFVAKLNRCIGIDGIRLWRDTKLEDKQ